MSWIKVRSNLCNDPRVLWLAGRLDVPRSQVIGMLVELWCYADNHSVDGTLRLITPNYIDSMVGCVNFAKAMIEVGWMHDGADGVTLVRYDEHNGCNAKRRAQGVTRGQRYRDAKASSRTQAASRSQDDDGVKREEKRRGEKKRESAHGRSKGGEGWI